MDATNPPDPRPELTPPAPTDAAPPEEQTLRGWLVQNGILIAVLAAVGVAIWWRARPDNPLAILSVVVGLGLLIFIHELGHFLAAKWCDVHVETFSVGFGPPIPGCAFRWGETTYMVGLVPLGGYVKMVGEGADSEEGEDDPRSFKNKTVIQRMIIISAGVVMNLLLGLACFVFVALTHGIREIPAVVGTVAPGTPAWEADVRRGDVIERVGSRSEPAFNDISLGVMKSADGVPIEVADAHVIGGKVQPPEVKRITPREVAGSPLPMFGLAPSARTTLGRSERKLPFRLNSPAAAATNPGFAIGDVVVATTDPDQPDPDKLLDLPPDPRVAPNEQAQPDFFTLRERLQRMADREIVLRVRRAHPRQHGGNVTEDIRVGRAPTHTLGLVMRMGPVVAIRAGSPAEVAQVRKTVAEEPDRGSALDPSWWIFGSRRSATPRQAVKGDRIETVELDLPPGSDKAIRRFTAVPLPDDPRAETRPLDPVRLPWELQRWAAAWRALPPEQRKDEVRLTVSRSEPKDAHDEAPRTVPLTLRWDDSRTFDDEAVFDPSSPLPIPGLGLAYAVEPVVAAVEPGSPAAEAGFEKDDVVTEIAFFEIGPDGNPTATARPVALEDDRKQPLPRWAGVFNALQGAESKQVRLKVRGKEEAVRTLTAVPSSDWSQGERGLLFEPAVRYHRATGLGDALLMAVNQELYYADFIYTSLKNLVTRPRTVLHLSGPLSIAATSYQVANNNIYDYIVFLGILNVNLAIVNFLPIPVLDGGHMVFLIYEGVRRKPPSERWRVGLTVAGLFFILGLMLFVVGLDVLKYFF